MFRNPVAVRRIQRTQYGSLFLDLILLVALLVAILLKHNALVSHWDSVIQVFKVHHKAISLIVLTWLLISYYTNLYEQSRYSGFVEVVKKLIGQWSIFFVVALTITGLNQNRLLFLNELLCLSALGLIIQFIYRLVVFLYQRSLRKNGKIKTNVLILDENDNLRSFLKLNTKRRDFGLEIKRILNLNPNPENALEAKFSEEQMVQTLIRDKIKLIYVCLNGKFNDAQIQKVVQLADDYYIKTLFIPNSIYDQSQNLQVTYYGTFPILTEKEFPLDDELNQFFKRIFDIVFSLLVIVLVLSWLTPILAYFIIRDSGWPLFFKQERNGLNGKVFDCLKFRTMYPNDQSNLKATERGDPRITPSGRILRKTSMDELPQFFNVLKGDMSVVGPRPHMVSQNKHFSDIINRYSLRHYVKPGITGLAQVNGYRGAIDTDRDMELRVESDVYYVRNWSFVLDIWIIFKTVYNTVVGDENAI